ncbi:hypothetical protein [Aliivibrio fischeri]|uniref:hypothetical protein n=1 Tax=Aliivibrio fischeri TaxID=668 RepID=UPI00084C6480|nr:hypothetical protein [Aliivibrio fischeri]OED55514.1 hypothetical protein BEI47_14830 [Aliivibrio fischeri]
MNYLIKTSVIFYLFVSFGIIASPLCKKWEDSGRLDTLTDGAKMVLIHKKDKEDSLEMIADTYAQMVSRSIKEKIPRHQCYVLMNVAASLVDNELDLSALELCEIYNG